MSEAEKRTADRLTKILLRLSEQDMAVFMAYGEGMANKAERMDRVISTMASAPGQART